jgi:flagellar biosynthetic protein FliO
MNETFSFGLFSLGLKSVSMLAIVLALLIGILYLTKRFTFFQGKFRNDLPINVVSSLHLSPKEKIQVVEISGERIVLGVTPNMINFLTKLDDGNE